MDIQRYLGSDIIMAFDECPSGQADEKLVSCAVDRTTKWIKKCSDFLNQNDSFYGWEQTLFPIIQGGIYPSLRKKSTEELVPFSKCGIAIGGLAVGEEKSLMFEIIDLMNTLLPKDQPRYLMGVGRPTDLVRSVQLGIDMFDCVLPTRNARNGQLFTSQGIINIGNKAHKEAFGQLDPNCKCYTCENFSKSYLRHLFNIKEVLGLRLATIHNLSYYMNLMEDIRNNIEAETFSSWSKAYLNKMNDYKGM